MTNIIKLPSHDSVNFHAELIEFGYYLEQTVRPNCKHDLNIYPNTIWNAIQSKMLEGLKSFIETDISSEQVLMLQWYNSGVFIKTGGQILGFDILAIPRFYNWPDTANLTTTIAKMVDILFITHEHEDHFDQILIDECIKLGKTIVTHPAIAKDKIINAKHNQLHNYFGFQIVSNHATHVWRQKQNDVYLAYYRVTCPNGFTFIFTGDADYTKDFTASGQKIDLLFLTWRNPNSLYEDGHDHQIGTTIDAINIATNKIKPSKIIFEHYGELDHVYKGFTASFDLAVSLINRLKVSSSINFWGDVIKL